jgi:uncharacterized membrane protein
MYTFFYFLHVLGVIIWVGAFISFGLLLRSLAKKEQLLDQHQGLLISMNRFVNRGVIPSSIIVLLSGVYLIMQFNRGDLPFYLTFMEQMGSLVILLSVILLTIQSRRINKWFNGDETDRKMSAKALSITYSRYMLGSALLALVVVFVVSMRIV